MMESPNNGRGRGLMGTSMSSVGSSLMGSLMGLSEEVDETTSVSNTKRKNTNLAAHSHLSGAKGLAAAQVARTSNKPKQRTTTTGDKSVASKENVQDKMKLIMDDPKLWHQFKARMAIQQGGSSGSSTVGIQAVLKDFVQDHPELEEMAQLQADTNSQQANAVGGNRRYSIMETMTHLTSDLAGETAAPRAASMGFISASSLSASSPNLSLPAARGFPVPPPPSPAGSARNLMTGAFDNSWSIIRKAKETLGNESVSSVMSDESSLECSAGHEMDHSNSRTLPTMGTFQETDEDGYASTDDDEPFEISETEIVRDGGDGSSQEICEGIVNLAVSRKYSD